MKKRILITGAAELANINNFIENQLAKKYETIVGERGIRLSGGQRQRVRIARAFYRKPKILILDEATNSIDNITEEKVLNNIININ